MKKNLYFLTISLVWSIFLQAEQDIREITAPDLLQALIKQKETGEQDMVLINVLNYNSYKDCHIKNSINLPIQHLKARAQHRFKTGKWKKDKMIVVYCANKECPLSRYAYQELVKIGFTNVWAYESGIKDWVNYSKQYGAYQYPTVGNACAGYLQ